jgi:hypothetical protein
VFGSLKDGEHCLVLKSLQFNGSCGARQEQPESENSERQFANSGVNQQEQFL